MIVLCFLVLFPASWYLVLSIPCTPNLALHSGYNYKQSSYWSFFFLIIPHKFHHAHHKQNHLKNWNKVPFFFSLHGIHNSSYSCFLLFWFVVKNELLLHSLAIITYLIASEYSEILHWILLYLALSCGYIGAIT